MSRCHEDQQLSEDRGNTEEDTHDTGEGQAQATHSRKRALTASASVLTAAKKSKPLEIIAEKLDTMMAVMTKPLEIVDKDQQAICDAVACWNRKFKAQPSDVKLDFMEE